MTKYFFMACQYYGFIDDVKKQQKKKKVFFFLLTKQNKPIITQHDNFQNIASFRIKLRHS